MAELCCACGLCTLYACPEDLYPKEACDRAKIEMKKTGVKYVQTQPVKVHPMKNGRRVPLKQLIKKLRLDDYNVHTPFTPEKPEPGSVKVLLKQHIGEVSISVVKIGDKVSAGDLIAKVPEGKLGANVHASIIGTVSQVSDDFIRITR